MLNDSKLQGMKSAIYSKTLFDTEKPLFMNPLAN